VLVVITGSLKVSGRLRGVVLLGLCGSDTHRSYASLDGVVVAEDGKRLTLLGVHGACDQVLPPVVHETPEEVTVSVPLRVEASSCIALGLSFRSTCRSKWPWVHDRW